jgi:hypothetical protein
MGLQGPKGDTGAQGPAGVGLEPRIGTDFNVDGQSSFNATNVNFVKFTDTDADIDTISTITNGTAGQILIIKFTADVNILDTETGAGNTIDLEHAGGPSASFYGRDTLMLIFDGTSWSELGQSVNSK